MVTSAPATKEEGSKQMRRRITRALFTAAAAGVTITTVGFTAGSAVAAVHYTPSAPQTGTDANCTTLGTETGTWTSSDCGKVGYVATGRDFRFAQALVTVPDRASTTNDPMVYVALDASASNPDYAHVGIEQDGAGGWQMFYDVEEPCTGVSTGTVPLLASTEGDGVTVSVYFNRAGNSLHLVATPPSGAALNKTISVCGPIYTDAQALADWSEAATAPAPAAPTDGNTRVTQFFQGRFTTQRGNQGTFNGPWDLTAVDATSNGSLQPNGSLIGQASYLWNDGHGYNGMGDDAFGVWLYQNG
jgi:hypothetical protein